MLVLLLEKLLGAGDMGAARVERVVLPWERWGKPAVWMYLVLLVLRASSVLHSYNLLHSNERLSPPTS